MPSFRLGSSGLAAVFAIGFAVALGILIQPGTSHAYTPEQQQACQPDAMRLCVSSFQMSMPSPPA
jgi:hypothetical protein